MSTAGPTAAQQPTQLVPFPIGRVEFLSKAIHIVEIGDGLNAIAHDDGNQPISVARVEGSSSNDLRKLFHEVVDMFVNAFDEGLLKPGTSEPRA